MNLVIITGNLGQNPDVKQSKSGTTIARMSVAVNERRKGSSGQYEKHTEWFRVVVFGKSADACSRYLSKGSKVAIRGRLQTSKWTDKEGVDRWITEVIAEQFGGIEFLDSRGSGMLGSQSHGSNQGQAKDDDGYDDDIPF